MYYGIGSSLVDAGTDNHTAISEDKPANFSSNLVLDGKDLFDLFSRKMDSVESGESTRQWSATYLPCLIRVKRAGHPSVFDYSIS